MTSKRAPAADYRPESRPSSIKRHDAECFQSFRRFWVLEGDSELLGESGEEVKQHLETESEEVNLKEEVSVKVNYFQELNRGERFSKRPLHAQQLLERLCFF